MYSGRDQRTVLSCTDSLCESRLREIDRCIVSFESPLSPSSPKAILQPKTVRVYAPHATATATIDSITLRSYCRLHNIPVATLTATAWGLVLREYTPVEGATFVQVTSIGDAFSPTLGEERLWHCRLDGTTLLGDLTTEVQFENLRPCSRECSLHSLYDTAICLQPQAEWGDLDNIELSKSNVRPLCLYKLRRY